MVPVEGERPDGGRDGDEGTHKEDVPADFTLWPRQAFLAADLSSGIINGDHGGSEAHRLAVVDATSAGPSEAPAAAEGVEDSEGRWAWWWLFHWELRLHSQYFG